MSADEDALAEARAALMRLADQAYWTAGDDAGRRRVIADRATVSRVFPSDEGAS